MPRDVFCEGDVVAAVGAGGRVLRVSVVSSVGRRYFSTSDGAKWIADGFDRARRFPPGPDAPFLRHATDSDRLLQDAHQAIEDLTAWKAPSNGVDRRRVTRAAALLR